MDFGFKAPQFGIDTGIPKIQPKQPVSSNPVSIPTQAMKSYNVQGTILPGVSDEKAQKLVSFVNSTVKSEQEKKLMINDLHQEAIKREQQEAFQKDRDTMKSTLMQQSVVEKDSNKKNQMKIQVAMANFADILREDAKKGGVNLIDMPDKEVVDKYLTAKPEEAKTMQDYLNGKLSSIDVGKKIGLIQEEPKETATGLGDFLSGKPIDTSREIGQFLDPFNTKGTGGADPSTALNLVGKTVLNIIPNTVSFAKGIGSMIFHPKQTVEGLKSLGQGIIDKSQGENTPQAQMVSGMWDSIKGTVTDPQKLGEWITNNPLDILAVVSPKTVVTAGESLIKGATKGISKTLGTLGKGTTTASEFVASQAFGINPSTIKNIVKDPALYSKVEQGVINSDELLSSLGTKIDENIAKIGETGKGYQAIKETANIETPIADINNSLAKRGIEIKDGKLDFTNTNMADSADLNAIQKAYDIVNTPKINVINMRGKLDDLINYESKATSKGQSVVKEIRNAIDTKAKTEIPGLSQLDASYSEQTKLLRSIKKDFLNPDGTFKDNALSKISNLTKKGNEAKLERVKELIPGIEDNINAIRAFEDVTLAGGQKVGSYLRGAGTVGVGAMAGGPVGAIIGLLITSPQVATNLLKGLGYTKEFIKGLTKNMKLGIKLNPTQIKALEKGAIGIPAGGIVGKDLLNNQ